MSTPQETQTPRERMTLYIIVGVISLALVVLVEHEQVSGDRARHPHGDSLPELHALSRQHVDIDLRGGGR